MRNNQILLLILILCFGFKPKENITTEVWVGSTPCDNELKMKLGINIQDSIDFIRWELKVIDAKSFLLDINYGICQPNTLGFISGGQHKSFQGSISKTPSGNGFSRIRLSSPSLKSDLMLKELNRSIYHILDNNNKLMVGNGGWSYSLSNKNGASKESTTLVANVSPLNLHVDNNTLTFAGRTPCEPVNSEYNLSLSDNCLKVKWQMKLYVDAVSKRPTSFYWNRTGHRASFIEGTWSIEKLGGVFICHLQPVQPYDSIDMLIVDENILYFLDKKHNLMPGDENFSFVLNRLAK